MGAAATRPGRGREVVSAVSWTVAITFVHYGRVGWLGSLVLLEVTTAMVSTVRPGAGILGLSSTWLLGMSGRCTELPVAGLTWW